MMEFQWIYVVTETIARFPAPRRHLRRGRPSCNSGLGPHPTYVNVNMSSGKTANHWVDSLQAAFPGLQVTMTNGKKRKLI